MNCRNNLEIKHQIYYIHTVIAKEAKTKGKEIEENELTGRNWSNVQMKKREKNSDEGELEQSPNGATSKRATSKSEIRG